MSSTGSKVEDRVASLLSSGRRAHRQGDLATALDCYRRILEISRDHPDALYLTALVLYRQRRTGEALEQARRAIGADPDHALAHASLGQMLQDAGRDGDAIVHLRRAASLRADNPNLYNALGLSLLHSGDRHGARTAFEQAIALAPALLQAHVNRANLLRLEGDFNVAQRGYEHCLALRPDCAEAHNNLGVLHQQRGRPARAAPHFEAAIAARGDYAEAYNNLGAVLNDLGQSGRALACFRRAVSLAPDFAEAHLNAGVAWLLAGRAERSRGALDEAARCAPHEPAVDWCRCMAELENVYQSPAHLSRQRRAYGERLESLAARIGRADARNRSAVARCIGLVQPFLLPYQGLDDLPLQTLYGDLVAAVAAGSNTSAARGNRPPRVGIVSGFFHDHSNWKVPVRGWLRHLSGAFEVHGYHTGFGDDACTAEARNLCRRFRTGLSVSEFADAIAGDGIDVLIYPEVGMNPTSMRLATQRLASVQCASWGHPVTTGLPTMDYFLSSELMEPPDGDAHYRETLVRLPGLSFTCQAPASAAPPVGDRQAFGLAAQDVVYLCVQNLSKYLPQHDHLLVAIAERVEAARFVFIAGAAGATDALRQRLRASFAGDRVAFRDRVVFLPRLSGERFAALNALADVCLDTPQWSGCNSTLEALARDVPTVTLPGRFMRSRHTSAFYRKMNHDTLIARDENHYVELAARLGLDPSWRAAQRRAIGACKGALYGDDTPLRALAEFIIHATREQAAGRAIQ